MIELIPIADRTIWEGTLAGVRHAFAHTWANCHAMSLTSGDATYLCRFGSGDAKVVCPIAERRYGDYLDIYTPYGFSGFAGGAIVNGDFSRAWNEFVKEREYVCGYFSLHPCLDAMDRLQVEGTDEVGVSYVLDLAVSQERLFAALHENRRRQLAHFSARSEIFVHDKAELEAFVLANYEQFYRARHAAATYNFTPATFSALAARNEVLLVGAASHGQLQAVSMFAYTQSAGDYLFNVSVAEGRHHSAALIWFAAVKLQSLGVPTLNLGGGVRGYDGVARFKERFGGKTKPLRCAKQIYRRDVYGQLCRTAGVDPDRERRYFPAYRAPAIGREVEAV
jgi:hypothetical protein